MKSFKVSACNYISALCVVILVAIVQGCTTLQSIKENFGRPDPPAQRRLYKKEAPTVSQYPRTDGSLGNQGSLVVIFPQLMDSGKRAYAVSDNLVVPLNWCGVVQSINESGQARNVKKECAQNISALHQRFGSLRKEFLDVTLVVERDGVSISKNIDNGVPRVSYSISELSELGVGYNNIFTLALITKAGASRYASVDITDPFPAVPQSSGADGLKSPANSQPLETAGRVVNIPTQSKPRAATSDKALSLSEVRWCIYQNVRLQACESRRCADLRSDYKASCAGARMTEKDKALVVKELEKVRPVLVNEGRRL